MMKSVGAAHNGVGVAGPRKDKGVQPSEEGMGAFFRFQVGIRSAYEGVFGARDNGVRKAVEGSGELWMVSTGIELIGSMKHESEQTEFQRCNIDF